MPGRGGPGKNGRIAGSVRRGRRQIRVDGRTYQASNLAWLYVYGRWPVRGLDHKNTIADDDRISNLRLATKAQNMQNSKPRADGIGIKGVGQHQGRYRARITIDGAQLHLGMFTTAEEAHAAYRRAARKHFGAFSYKEQR
jgi:hypothetical protein